MLDPLLQMLRNSAEHGDNLAKYFLTVYYGEDTGVPVLHLLRKAAEQGDPMVQYLLAVCYSDGAGVPQKVMVPGYPKTLPKQSFGTAKPLNKEIPWPNMT
jgi:hypothetical protein